jgi:hypothetical protein
MEGTFVVTLLFRSVHALLIWLSEVQNIFIVREEIHLVFISKNAPVLPSLHHCASIHYHLFSDYLLDNEPVT